MEQSYSFVRVESQNNVDETYNRHHCRNCSPRERTFSGREGLTGSYRRILRPHSPASFLGVLL